MYFKKSLCRVSTKKHSAKKLFAECQHSVKKLFAECQIWHSAKESLPSVSSLPSVDSLALVPEKKHSAKSLPLGKDMFSSSDYKAYFTQFFLM
jgi:hypothetical protein